MLSGNGRALAQPERVEPGPAFRQVEDSPVGTGLIDLDCREAGLETVEDRHGQVGAVTQVRENVRDHVVVGAVVMRSGVHVIMPVGQTVARAGIVHLEIIAHEVSLGHAA